MPLFLKNRRRSVMNSGAGFYIFSAGCVVGLPDIGAEIGSMRNQRIFVRPKTRKQEATLISNCRSPCGVLAVANGIR